MSRHYDEATLHEMIDYCLNLRYPRDVSKWEKSFLESISDQLDREGTLSAKQEEILERIHQDR